MKVIIHVMTFALRHFLIVCFAMLAGFILWTIAYVVLLAIAVIWNKGLGGPLAYPSGILAILATGIFIGWSIFAPASAIGAVFCRIFGLPRLAAIPVVFLSSFVISYFLYWAYIELVTTHSMPSAWIVFKNHTIYLSVPLGVYWWLTEGPGAIFDVFRRWIRNRRSKNN